MEKKVKIYFKKYENFRADMDKIFSSIQLRYYIFISYMYRRVDIWNLILVKFTFHFSRSNEAMTYVWEPLKGSNDRLRWTWKLIQRQNIVNSLKDIKIFLNLLSYGFRLFFSSQNRTSNPLQGVKAREKNRNLL